MRNVARIGDTIDHGGAIVSGSEKLLTNGIPTARIGDSVICQIHGGQVITSGSDNLFADDRNVARIGDSVSCGAVIVSGSPDTFNDDKG